MTVKEALTLAAADEQRGGPDFAKSTGMARFIDVVDEFLESMGQDDEIDVDVSELTWLADLLTEAASLRGASRT